MIKISNLKDVLNSIGYKEDKDSFIKEYQEFGCAIIVNFKEKTIQYPEESGLKVHKKTTCNFSESENFVVLECVTRLLDKGYRPEHIELEKTWSLGHEQKSGRADVLVKEDTGKTLFIIECKTYGKEYEKALKDTIHDGAQLFSYWQQEKHCKWLALYTSTLNKGKVEYKVRAIDCSDDKNLEELAKKDSSIKLYKNAYTVPDLHNVWKETHERRLLGDIFFRDDSVAYQVGVKPLRKRDLVDFSGDDKVVNRFEEILRHNNVSDKENAFNRLIALFICKLVDELQKDESDEVDFQYKIGTDTYESLQDRLQRLHKEGMEKFMKEDIFYIPEDYAKKTVETYTGNNRKALIKELDKTLRILKFYTNNDFAFKDVHNEELFYQNGKILVEVVKLFQNYRIIGSNNLQLLGDLFEQLLNKGFKQNEGQFFTPVPITRFIWDSLPLECIIKNDGKTKIPKIIDYACGAGHFLTEGVEAVNDILMQDSSDKDMKASWVRDYIYGIEKDYRLARVSKISLFMHGAGTGNIIFGDGLENHREKGVHPHTFDILVANPPYSVSAFKPHLNLKDNDFTLLDKISNSGSEIETLFVERLAQLLKPKAVAAIILPSSILNKENESFIGAREVILKHFKIKAVVSLSSKTFGATGTNTVVLFLEKFDEPPKKVELVKDSVDAITGGEKLSSWEDGDIYKAYLKMIDVSQEEYEGFIHRKYDYDQVESKYFSNYAAEFLKGSDVKAKREQKRFKTLNQKEQKSILNKMFYAYTIAIEKEKIQYFALTYKERTLIINAPSDNKEQEEFLGYKWSNRKGQEGIQITKLGGKLYHADNRSDTNTLAALIRDAFRGKERSITELEDCYYYLNTKDMLDFKNVSFNKGIRTRKVKVLKNDPRLTTYYLSDENIFELFIGDRVVNTELVENGKVPVYSANVFEVFGKIDKLNIKDFSKPSIVWGIDGDWMVNFLPKDYIFYPTDHCGVLRLKTDKILPEYILYALKVEGEYERFSRTYRASIQKIKQLIIQVPPIDVQKEIISELQKYDEIIEREDSKLKEYDENIKSKFVEMFRENNYIYMSINQIALKVFAGGDRPIDCSDVQSNEYPYPVISNGSSNDGILCYSKKYVVDQPAITVSARGTIGYTSIRNKKFTPIVRLITILPKENINLGYLKYCIDSLDIVKTGSGAGQLIVPDFVKLKIPVVSLEVQNQFSSYVEEIDKLKFEAKERKIKAEQEKENLIEKHFR